MKVFAPGKLVLTGAYAVLHGAPAIVLATSRGATADPSRVALVGTPEVRAAIGDAPAPHVDASALFLGDRKLGLGASAAILVASLGAREAAAGADLAEMRTRVALFDRARAAHADAQGGGSGVDVAASVFGGALRYRVGAPPVRVALPPGTHLSVFACGTSARTTELRADVDRLAEVKPETHRVCMDQLGATARVAADAVERGDRHALVAAIAHAAKGLRRLGEAARAPIVPGGFEELEELATAEGAAFCVAGAGGGDVAAFVGSAAASRTFCERAHALGLFRLDLEMDEKGMRVLSSVPAFAGALSAACPPGT